MKSVGSILEPLTLIHLCLLYATADHWAVIVVGSRGYWNYRHQSDACHAYHVVHDHGIPKKNIILMMYNDVAHDSKNPLPGTLYNRPTLSRSTGQVTEPKNVYDGCHVEYAGDAVTPQNFMNVLLGNKTASNGKRVLESTKTDRVFINFVDHGANGYIVFPGTKKLTARQLHSTLLQMYTENRYKEVVLYMEACHSGSMFINRLPRKYNIFVTTAANRHESSWATYCPPYDKAYNHSIGSCLGDLYSVNWMDDSDLADLSTETLAQQYEKVKRETTKSHVKRFGSQTVENEIVGNFQSVDDISVIEATARNASDKVITPISAQDLKVISAVETYDVELIGKFYRYLRSESVSDRTRSVYDLMEELRKRIRADEVFDRLNTVARNVVDRVQGSDSGWECYERALKMFDVSCAGLGDSELGGAFTSYSLKYTETFAALCASYKNHSAGVERKMEQVCLELQKDESFFKGVNDRHSGKVDLS